MPDHYTKARAAGYYNGLLSGNIQGFEKLLRKYSIYPGDQVPGTQVTRLGDIATGATSTNARLAAGTSTGIQMAEVGNMQKVAYADLGLDPRQQPLGGSPGDRVSLTCSYQNAAGTVPVYYLPWDNQKSIRLTIPQMVPGDGTPDIFFTAAISGCSVIFQGTSQSPTIYHCGGDTGFGNNYGGSARFWRAVVDEFIADDAANNRPNLGQRRNESVDKRDYVKQVGVMDTSTIGGVTTTGGSTQRAVNYKNTLVAQHPDMVIEDVAPWGCVLGRRDVNGDWTFYLQKNATVIYHAVKKRFLRKNKHSTSYNVSRPLVVREVFPRGAHHACIQAPLPRIV